MSIVKNTAVVVLSLMDDVSSNGGAAGAGAGLTLPTKALFVKSNTRLLRSPGFAQGPQTPRAFHLFAMAVTAHAYPEVFGVFYDNYWRLLNGPTDSRLRKERVEPDGTVPASVVQGSLLNILNHSYGALVDPDSVYTGKKTSQMFNRSLLRTPTGGDAPFPARDSAEDLRAMNFMVPADEAARRAWAGASPVNRFFANADSMVAFASQRTMFVPPFHHRDAFEVFYAALVHYTDGHFGSRDARKTRSTEAVLNEAVGLMGKFFTEPSAPPPEANMPELREKIFRYVQGVAVDGGPIPPPVVTSEVYAMVSHMDFCFNFVTVSLRNQASENYVLRAQQVVEAILKAGSVMFGVAARELGAELHENLSMNFIADVCGGSAAIFNDMFVMHEARAAPMFTPLSAIDTSLELALIYVNLGNRLSEYQQFARSIKDRLDKGKAPLRAVKDSFETIEQEVDIVAAGGYKKRVAELMILSKNENRKHINQQKMESARRRRQALKAAKQRGLELPPGPNKAGRPRRQRLDPDTPVVQADGDEDDDDHGPDGDQYDQMRAIGLANAVNRHALIAGNLPASWLLRDPYAPNEAQPALLESIVVPMPSLFSKIIPWASSASSFSTSYVGPPLSTVEDDGRTLPMLDEEIYAAAFPGVDPPTVAAVYYPLPAPSESRPLLGDGVDQTKIPFNVPTPNVQPPADDEIDDTTPPQPMPPPDFSTEGENADPVAVSDALLRQLQQTSGPPAPAVDDDGEDALFGFDGTHPPLLLELTPEERASIAAREQELDFLNARGALLPNEDGLLPPFDLFHEHDPVYNTWGARYGDDVDIDADEPIPNFSTEPSPVSATQLQEFYGIQF